MNRVLAVLIGFLLAFPILSFAEFSIETIDNEENTGIGIDMAMDSTGRIYICYSSAEEVFKVADGWPETWSSSEVAEYGINCSITVDSKDTPHLVYQLAGTINRVEYLRWESDDWYGFELTNADEGVGISNSIMVDENDLPRVATLHNGYEVIQFFYFIDQNNFNSAYIGDNEFTIDQGFLSLAVASPTENYITFFDNSEQDTQNLFVVKGNSETWDSYLIDGDESYDWLGWDNAIAIDNEGDLHIAYYNKTEGSLHYAAGHPANMTLEKVDIIGDCGHPLDLALDSLGQPHVCYHDAENQTLRYGYRDEDGWYLYQIDQGDGVGESCSIVLDSSDMVFVAYHKGEEGLAIAYGDADGEPQVSGGDDDEADSGFDGDDDDDSSVCGC